MDVMRVLRELKLQEQGKERQISSRKRQTNALFVKLHIFQQIIAENRPRAAHRAVPSMTSKIGEKGNARGLFVRWKQEHFTNRQGTILHVSFLSARSGDKYSHSKSRVSLYSAHSQPQIAFTSPKNHRFFPCLTHTPIQNNPHTKPKSAKTPPKIASSHSSSPFPTIFPHFHLKLPHIPPSTLALMCINVQCIMQCMSPTGFFSLQLADTATGFPLLLFLKPHHLSRPTFLLQFGKFITHLVHGSAPHCHFLLLKFIDLTCHNKFILSQGWTSFDSKLGLAAFELLRCESQGKSGGETF